MIGPVSALSAAALRPIIATPLASNRMASESSPVPASSAPAAAAMVTAQPLALAAPTMSPSLNVATNKVDTEGADAQKRNTTTASGLPQAQPGQAAAGEKTSDGSAGKQLTPEEQAQVAKLRSRDREVRAHEQAHAAAGGALAGAPSYTYQTGPDGKQYAVGGEVPIRASVSSSNPRQAIAQLQQVARAAMAPAHPSAQDRAVAAQARAQMAQLQAQLASESQGQAADAKRPGAAEPGQPNGAAPTGLPPLPDLPRLAPAGSRASGAAPAGDGSAAPSSVIPASPAPESRGETPTGAGPIAAYQQTDARTAKAASVTGRVLSLSA